MLDLGVLNYLLESKNLKQPLSSFDPIKVAKQSSPLPVVT